MSYGFQISETFRLVCTGKEFEFSFRKDGDFSSQDENLRVCLTGFVALDNYVEGVKGFKLKLEGGEFYESKRGSLVLLKSRFVGYELEYQGEKSFAIQYWVNGPKDTKQKRF